MLYGTEIVARTQNQAALCLPEIVGEPTVGSPATSSS